MNWTKLTWRAGDDWPSLPDTFLAYITWKDQSGRERFKYTVVTQDEGRYDFDDCGGWGLEDISYWAPITKPA